jgi:hypothetical protein
MHFVRAVAFDPGANAVYTITVPTPRASRLVVSQFDRRDLTLSREFLPVAGGGAEPGLRSGRTLDELYVTAATVRHGLLYGLSAAYATVIAIDPASGRVVSAFGLRGVRRPAGVAVRAGEMYVAAEDGAVHVFPLPAGSKDDAQSAPARK